MNKLKKIINLLEFITSIDFKDLPDKIKSLINSDNLLKDYDKVLKSSHYFRIVYSKNIPEDKLKEYSDKLNMPVTFEKNTLLLQYKEK